MFYLPFPTDVCHFTINLCIDKLGHVTCWMCNTLSGGYNVYHYKIKLYN